MTKTLPKLCLTMLLSALGAGLAVAPAMSALAQSKTTAEVAALQGDARSQELVEAAKKEGELNIYLAHPSVPQVTAAFTKKYGIKVNVWRAGSEAILQRVVTEARGNRFDVDIVENNAPEMEALHREKLLQDAKSPYTAGLMPTAIPPHKEWIGMSIDMFTLGYNTSKVKKEDLPKTWADLADPKWKGQIGLEAEDQTWFAYVLKSIGEEKGTKLFKEVVATNGLSVRKGHSLLGQLLSSGEVTLALDLYSWNADQLKEKGAPIERFQLSEPIVQFQGLGLMKKAPHPNAAVLFFDFMLTDGQAIMSKAHAIATSNKYDQAEKSVPLIYIDPVTAMDLNDQRYKTYQDIFVKRMK